MVYEKEFIFDFLKQHAIDSITIEHPPLLTIEDALLSSLPSVPCKNLFLQDAKKQCWLIVALHDTRIRLNDLRKKIHAPGLHFASQEVLMHYLKVKPGTVTPFALINDNQRQVKVILDVRMFQKEKVGFHPLTNEATTYLKPADLITFLKVLGTQVSEMDLHEA